MKERIDKISKSTKGRTPHNKGVYGEKRKRFEKGLPITCVHHGEHNNWRYNEKYRQIACRYCTNENAKKHRYDNFFVKWIFSSRRKSKQNDLTVQFLAKLYLKQGGLCALSGLPLHEDVMSLDRIDSTKIYMKKNVQWVHIMVNRMKSNFKQNHFIKMCSKISNHSKNKKLCRLNQKNSKKPVTQQMVSVVKLTA